MNKNSENTKKGRDFQVLAVKLLSKLFGQAFNNEEAIPIGEPAKNHKFACVSEDKSIVAECKCHTWTVSGNVPSAKIGFINQAVFYMNYLPKNVKKIIVMKKAIHIKRNETLAEYYFRMNKHLLKGISLFEIDVDNNRINVIKE